MYVSCGTRHDQDANVDIDVGLGFINRNINLLVLCAINIMAVYLYYITHERCYGHYMQNTYIRMDSFFPFLDSPLHRAHAFELYPEQYYY